MEGSAGSNAHRVMSPASVSKRITWCRPASPGTEGAPPGALAGGSGSGRTGPVCSLSASLSPGQRPVPEECARGMCPAFLCFEETRRHCSELITRPELPVPVHVSRLGSRPQICSLLTPREPFSALCEASSRLTLLHRDPGLSIRQVFEGRGVWGLLLKEGKEPGIMA